MTITLPTPPPPVVSTPIPTTPPPPQGTELDELVDQLLSIQPEFGVFLDVTPAEDCGISIEPEFMGCPEDIRMCPDGSSVVRQPPSCNFAPCL